MPDPEETATETNGTEIATFGMGCFWCGEAVFQRIDGVKAVTSGYMGGTLKNPSYEQVCTGETGHAEVIQVSYDPKAASFETLVDLFFRAHDPTQLNRQGGDIGPQYRSAIFYHSETQREQAEAAFKRAAASGAHEGKIVTEITEASIFYPAENYHQDFYDRNREYPYCRVIIDPKLQKLKLQP